MTWNKVKSVGQETRHRKTPAQTHPKHLLARGGGGGGEAVQLFRIFHRTQLFHTG